jgi:hypothetical protein
MAMVPCRKCKQVVADNAKACLNCGAKDPGKDVPMRTLAAIVVAIAGIAAATYALDKDGGRGAVPPAKQEAPLQPTGAN